MSKYPYVSENKCLFCNGDITITRSRGKNKKYCSNGCVSRHLNITIKNKSNCLNCGNEFEHKWEGEKKIFCSKNCHLEHKKRNRKIYESTCKACGKIFYPKQINYTRNTNIYCSDTCRFTLRTYNLDQNYFNIIDTEDKAYWLGFIYADGNIYKSTFTVKLNIKDEEHLMCLKNCLKLDSDIKYVPHNNCCEIRAYSIKLVEGLKQHGVMSNKTFKIEMPLLREDLYNDFIRGYFDGDGCIYVGKKYHGFSMYTASNKFQDSLFNYFENNLNIRLNRCKSNLSKSKIEDLIKIYYFLYDKENLLYLKRKQEKFNKFVLLHQKLKQ